MKIKRWYWLVLALWLVTGLPIYLLGQGMFGQSIFDVFGFIRDIRIPTSSWDAFITWFIPMVLIFMPFLFLPFALTKARLSSDEKDPGHSEGHNT